ncbi:MAG: hydroxyacylglutathione hydrolase [Magnetococcales bacterium]|nr:hydroxyacylglutathione hydrolase [Magnetococcales bacterium]
MPQPPLRVESLLSGRDNLVWVLATGSGRCAVIDPGDAEPVSDHLAMKGWTLSHILLTHHHGDHTAGVATLARRHGAMVVGAEAERNRLPPLDLAVGHGDVVALGTLEARVVAVSGHTLGHVVYLVEDCLFSGDTLFGFGCGRLFEGSPAMMWESLSRLAALPDATRLCAGHEYTLLNLDFVCHLEPERADLTALRHEIMAIVERGECTLPHPLALEKRFNPFLRASDPAFAARVGLAGQSPLEVFTALRERRNRF